MANSQGLIPSPLSYLDSESSLRYYAQYKELVLLPDECEDEFRIEDIGEGKESGFEHDYYSVPDALDRIPIDESNNNIYIENKKPSHMSVCAQNQQENLYLRSTILSPLKTEAETLPSIASRSYLLDQQSDYSISDSLHTRISAATSPPQLLTSLLPSQSHQHSPGKGQGT